MPAPWTWLGSSYGAPTSSYLEAFELFAREHRPLSLTELARGLEVPMSSTLALVRTLAAKGYVYEIRPRGGYYPTRKMRTACAAIRASAAESVARAAEAARSHWASVYFASVART